MSTTHVLLIRHALNDWVGKRLAGWTPGVHLNAVGLSQARALAQRLGAVRLAAVYSSPLERARETAQPFASAAGLEVVVREDLGEIRCGEWTGFSLEELERHELWPAVQVAPSGVRLPGGEWYREAQSRMVAAIDDIRAAHPDQTIAVVSHADPIKLAVAFYAGIPLDLFQRLAVDPASVTVLAFARLWPQLLCLNRTETLPASIAQIANSCEQAPGAIRKEL